MSVKKIDKIYSNLESSKSCLKDQTLDPVRELKDELLKLDAVIDLELLEFSTAQTSPSRTNLNDIMERKEVISEILTRLASSSIRQKLQEIHVELSNQEILADIIGLKPELANVIFVEQDHESEEDQIHRYFNVIYNNNLQDKVR